MNDLAKVDIKPANIYRASISRKLHYNFFEWELKFSQTQKVYIKNSIYLPFIKWTGAHNSNSIVASLLRTQWYAKLSEFVVHVWTFPISLQLFLLAADDHSMALEGQRDTMETVEMDSGHIFNAKDYNGKSKVLRFVFKLKLHSTGQ